MQLRTSRNGPSLSVTATVAQANSSDAKERHSYAHTRKSHILTFSVNSLGPGGRAPGCDGFAGSLGLRSVTFGDGKIPPAPAHHQPHLHLGNCAESISGILQTSMDAPARPQGSSVFPVSQSRCRHPDPHRATIVPEQTGVTKTPTASLMISQTTSDTDNQLPPPRRRYRVTVLHRSMHDAEEIAHAILERVQVPYDLTSIDLESRVPPGEAPASSSQFEHDDA